MKIKIKKYNLNSNKINCNIVLISDIHYYSKKDIGKLNKLTLKINTIKPNYICITGDLFDESIVSDDNLCINWIKDLAKICKVIISLGNHDISIRYPKRKYINKELLNKLKKLRNVFLIDNDVFTDNNITFIGLTNSYEYYDQSENKDIFIKELNSLKIKLNRKNYNILLCHSPISITKNIVGDCAILKDINLVLCGHTHGGITPSIFRCIIKNGGLISPSKKLFMKDAYGYINRNNIEYIISSGITKASHSNPFRFVNNLFSSEIVSININNNKDL